MRTHLRDPDRTGDMRVVRPRLPRRTPRGTLCHLGGLGSALPGVDRPGIDGRVPGPRRGDLAVLVRLRCALHRLRTELHRGRGPIHRGFVRRDTRGSPGSHATASFDGRRGGPADGRQPASRHGGGTARGRWYGTLAAGHDQRCAQPGPPRLPVRILLAGVLPRRALDGPREPDQGLWRLDGWPSVPRPRRVHQQPGGAARRRL